MAKFVIAGVADCPYYAKAELLGDSLQENLADFKLHKIVKNQKEWKDWLESTCSKRGWSHKRSPLIWRELVDRGGKGVLIGGANEFQEYAYSYYDIKSGFNSTDMTTIATENLQTALEQEEEEASFQAQSHPIKVCISNASSNVAYNMIADIARGDALGPDTEITLTLLDTEDNMDSLAAVEMEAFDLACPLLRDITTTSNIHQAFTDCSIVFILDELTQDPEESKEDWIKRNHQHFTQYAKVIEESARKDVKVIISGHGPINFNAQMMIEAAPGISRYNIVAVPRMVENHAKSILAERLKVNSAGIVDIIIWGNVNSTLFVDVSKARVHGYDGAIWGPPSFSLCATDTVHDEKWIQSEFLELLSNRMERVEKTLGHSAARSQAACLVTLLNHWWNGKTSGQIFSLGVSSDGSYGVPEGQVFSVPVTFSTQGYWVVVQDIELSDENKQKLQDIVQELREEREVIYPPPKPPTPPPTETEPEAETEPDNINNSAVSEAEGTSGEDAIKEGTDEDAEAEQEEAEDPDKPSSSLRRIIEDKEGETQAEQGLRKSREDAGQKEEAEEQQQQENED